MKGTVKQAMIFLLFPKKIGKDKSVIPETIRLLDLAWPFSNISSINDSHSTLLKSWFVSSNKFSEFSHNLSGM
jgi:hypothetical protein